MVNATSRLRREPSSGLGTTGSFLTIFSVSVSGSGPGGGVDSGEKGSSDGGRVVETGSCDVDRVVETDGRAVAWAFSSGRSTPTFRRRPDFVSVGQLTVS